MMVGLASAVAVVCFMTAAIDIGMNGAQYARWAPYGLAIGLLAAIVMNL